MAAYKQLYVHCVWATWDRDPLVTPLLAEPLYAALAAKSRALNCRPIAINGMPDHVHMLIEFAATLPLARLVGELKGSSSHLVTHVLAPGSQFKWQGSYSAFTVSKQEVPWVQTYIQKQQQHHAGHSIVAAFETTDEER